VAKSGKLELTWVGKDERVRLEPRVLVEDPSKSYGDPNAENMLIFGDNLLALKALEQDFAGKIKCVFIDPPYNTGSAFEHYEDGLEHSLWLSLMRDRLELIWRLLSADGSLWVTIDDNEGHYLKVLCDEVLGRANFAANIVWQSKDTPGNNSAGIAETHNHVLCYKKSEMFRPNLLARNAKQIATYSNPDNDARGPWLGTPLTRAEHRDRDYYGIRNPAGREVLPPKGSSWRRPPAKMKQLARDNRIWWGKGGDAEFPMEKKFLSEVKEGVVNQTWWPYEFAGSTRNASAELKGLFGGVKAFGTPKPEKLIQRVLDLASAPNDWVLDSFSGSGTTGAVAHKMGRRWIMVELGEHCYTHIIPRMQKVTDGTDQGGISKSVNWQGGGGFKYYRLAESLLVRDKDLSTKSHPVYIINPRYNDRLLIQAICKIENFRYRNEGRLHGISSERRFLHVTTLLLTQGYLDSLAEDIGLDQSLLIYCTRKVRGLRVPDNVEVKKIPRDLLAKCDFQEDK
jgi:adenine-specific DNA-methyltransferase